MDKLLVLVGPTSSGKSELAVRLAKKFNGEIISCDSRQIYRGLDLGTGKVPGRWQTDGHPERSEGSGKLMPAKNPQFAIRNSQFIYKSIPHHLIDFVSPTRRYSVADFQKQAQKIIADTVKRGKLPILCGGTAHWIDAVIYNQYLPDVKPNLKLRASLEKKSAVKLFGQLKKLDPTRASTIDPHNPRRLIRALEIVISTGKPVPNNGTILRSAADEGSKKTDSSDALRMTAWDVLWLGIKVPQKNLYKKIDTRLKQRLKTGMIKEVEYLHKNLPLKSYTLNPKSPRGLSWKLLQSFGLEYKYISLYLQKKLSCDEMLTQLSFAIKHYSKRQLTWWKRNKQIKWMANKKSADAKIKKFLLSKNSDTA